MSRYFQKFSFFTLFSILLLSACANADQNQDVSHAKDTISVTGLGEVSAEPDQATVSVTVSSTNINVNAAKAEADRKYKLVIAAAKNQGVAKTDIKLSSLNMQPEYNWRNNTQVLIGTRVSRSLSITLDEIKRVAPLLQELIEGEVSTIDGVQTGFKNRELMARKALAAAIDDAKDKAEFLAKQFDKELGSAYTIAEHSQQTPVFRAFNQGMMEAKSMSSSAPQEHFGTQKVKATVSVVFHAQ